MAKVLSRIASKPASKVASKIVKLDRATVATLRSRLLTWYERNRRDLPWRRTANPYSIWVSEIMLQQTRVAAVVEHYRTFLQRFPTLLSLSLASEEDVLEEWSGLGYYRRARLLHKAAQFVTNQLDGNLPVTSEALCELPGVGAYTAAAIASIAHGEPVAVVDGNVERVLCRLAGWELGSRAGGATLKKQIDALAGQLVDPARPGDFNQAVMELGATVCLPRAPHCRLCPWYHQCKTRGEHNTVPRPRMLSKEIAQALSVRTSQHPGQSWREVLLEQRPASQTVMPGMWELPALREETVPEAELRMTVRHAIMQVNYYVRIRTVFEDDVPALTIEGGERRWAPLNIAAGMALTGLARKVLNRAHLLPRAPVEVMAADAETDEI